MNLGFAFFFNAVMLGVGLAMDAFSVSKAKGLHEPDMKKRRLCGIALVFAIFQGLMPMIGWICIHTIVQYFTAFESLIPWIALILLCFIGGKMLWEGIHSDGETACELKPGLGLTALLVQGVATSIDALSVGFTIAEYGLLEAVLAALLIGGVTFFICLGGVLIGRKAGTRLTGKAGIFGGVILIAIGLEIFNSSFL